MCLHTKTAHHQTANHKKCVSQYCSSPAISRLSSLILALYSHAVIAGSIIVSLCFSGHKHHSLPEIPFINLLVPLMGNQDQSQTSNIPLL